MTPRAFLLGLIVALAIASPVRASGISPDPNVLLMNVRQQQAAQKGVLHARLREKASSTPFRIIWQEGTIRYEFSNPDQILFLKLGDKSTEMWERQGGQSSTIIASRFDQRVRGTSVTYEDLAFRFLYWPNPTIAGEDHLRTRPAWILQVISPGKSSRYGVVRIWIDKESNALLRMEGFDYQGRSIKRFEVVSAQKLKGQWLLKEMRIEERDPATEKVIDRAYLTISS